MTAVGTVLALPAPTVADACRSLGLTSEPCRRLASEVYRILEDQSKRSSQEPESGDAAAKAKTTAGAALLSRVLIPTFTRRDTPIARDHGDGGKASDGCDVDANATKSSSAEGAEPQPMEGVETTELIATTTSDGGDARLLTGGRNKKASDEKSAKSRGEDTVGGRTSLVAFAHFLRKFETGGEDNGLNVANIASYCIDLLEKNDCSQADGKSFMQGLHSIAFLYTKSQGEFTIDGEPPSKDDLARLRLLLIGALRAILVDVQMSVESTADFFLLWDSCLENEVFASLIASDEQQDTQLALNTAAECAFSIANVIAVQNQVKYSTNTLSCPLGRRKQFVLTSAACIAIVCESVDKRPSQSEQGTEKRVEPQPKRRRIVGKSGMAGSDDGEKENEDSNKSRPLYKTRRTVETDAIDTLTMMVSRGTDEKSSASNVIETLVDASNELLSLLYESSTDDVANDKLKQAHIENEIHRVTKYCLEVREKLHLVSFAGTVSPTFNGNTTECIEGGNDKSDGKTPKIANSLMPYLATNHARSRNCEILAEAYRNEILPLDGLPFVDRLALFQKTKCDIINATVTLIRCQMIGAPSGLMKTQADETPVAKIAIIEKKLPAVSKSHKDAPGSLSKSCVTVPMELNEWVNSLFLLVSRTRTIKPSARLALYLGSTSLLENNEFTPEWRDVVIPLLNETFERIPEHFANLSADQNWGRSNAAAEGSDNSRIKLNSGHPLKVDENGVLDLTDVDIPSDFPSQLTDTALAATMLALYYQSLESILFDETARLKTASHPKLVLSQPFHRALLSICCICILKASGVSPSTCSTNNDLSSLAFGPADAPSILDLMGCTPYGYLKVSESFLRSSSKHGGGLPAKVRLHVRETDELMLDSWIWASPSDSGSSTIMTIIQELKEDCYWPPAVLRPSLPQELTDEHANGRSKDDPISPHSSSPQYHGYSYVQYLLRKLLSISAHRMASLCEALRIPAIVASQIWIAFRFLLRFHIELLQDRHVDHLIMCTVYGVSKIVGLDKSNDLFSRIIRAYQILNEDKGEHVCQRIIRHVKLDSDLQCARNGKQLKPYGSVLDLYNRVYVKKMRKHLLQSASLKQAAAEWKKRESERGCDGHLKKAARTQNEVSAILKGRSPVRIEGTNFYLRVSSSTTGVSEMSEKRAKLWEVSGSKVRGIYSFGDPGVKDLALVNRMIYCSQRVEGTDSASEENEKTAVRST